MTLFILAIIPTSVFAYYPAGRVIRLAELQTTDFEKTTVDVNYSEIPTQVTQYKLASHELSKPGYRFSSGRPSESFIIIGRIGTGGEAVLYRVRSVSNNAEYALKIYRRRTTQTPTLDFVSEPNEQSPLQDIRLVYNLDRRSLGVLMNVHDPVFAGRWILPGDTDSTISFGYQMVAEVTSQIFYLNKLGLYHGDIKPENLLMSTDGRRIYLADIDQPQFLGVQPKVATDFYSTKIYRSDMANGQFHGAELDLHGLGVMTLEYIDAVLATDKLTNLQLAKLNRLKQLAEVLLHLRVFQLEAAGSKPTTRIHNLHNKTYWKRLKKFLNIDPSSSVEDVLRAITAFALKADAKTCSEILRNAA